MYQTNSIVIQKSVAASDSDRKRDKTSYKRVYSIIQTYVYTQSSGGLNLRSFLSFYVEKKKMEERFLRNFIVTWHNQSTMDALIG